MKRNPKVVVIGAGIGGLTTAALLLKAGCEVTVLEAGAYPGGSAGTFFHQGYRFDAGATLAGGFNTGGPHTRIEDWLGLKWPVQPADPAWIVHLPERSIIQHASKERWHEERRKHFPHSEPFWKKQGKLAEAAWRISSGNFPWPPVHLRDWISLLKALNVPIMAVSPFAFRKVSDLVPDHYGQEFKTFLDAQLIISAQTTSQYTNALYGSAALDLPRRGVHSVINGMGALSETLAEWIKRNGGEIYYKQLVDFISVKNNSASMVSTRDGLTIEAEAVVANLTPHALLGLLKEQSPGYLHRIIKARPPRWGTFMVYLGLESHALPDLRSNHHQIIRDINIPLGETNSIFLSLSDERDASRAPAGMRAATISTHTRISHWYKLAKESRTAYLEEKEAFYKRVLETAERAIPGFHRAIRFVMTGTPKTFEFYTHRPNGMAGGFPQTSLFNVLSPKTGIRNLWMVGDSIFPGQSTAGVTLGAIRTAGDILSTFS